tara:strand:+ start:823 stop:2346 length:1524 start_codon:yes stop_codon:yes gene_type:complete
MENKCVTELKNILEENKDDKDIIEWIYDFLKNDVVKKIKKNRQERALQLQLMVEKHHYINTFLDSDIKYYSLKNIREDVIYIKYDGVTFEYCKKDEIIHNVIQDLNKNELLSDMKYDIADDILALISKRNLFDAMPESKTIQYVISFFCPMFFYIKEELKYFFTVIGDSILKKQQNEIYYVPECSREFLSLINVFYKDYTGVDANLNKFKFKYRGCNYKSSRLIKIKKSISSIVYINEFLKKNIFNIIVVSCHYSLRYSNAENYLNKQNDKIKDDILFLSKHCKLTLIDDFLNEQTFTSSNTISNTEMYFLWKLYCDKKNMPIALYSDEFYKIINEKVDWDSNGYKNIYSSYLEPAKYFNQFWEFSIEETSKGDDYFELSEICELYNIWLKKKKDIVMKPLRESKMKELIQFFYPDVEFNNNMIIDRKCIFWDKKKDIKESLDKHFLKDINKDLTFLEAYLSYCSYCDKSKKLNIVSKKYFEKYIGNIIPDMYIQNKIILSHFWSKR